MSSNRRSPDLSKHTLRLRAGDMGTIQAKFPTIGANAAIRNHISRWVDEMRRNTKPADIEVEMKEPAANV